jgi:polar amino acid transport system substrate-binding protein
MRATLWLAAGMCGLFALRGVAQESIPTPEIQRVLAPTGRLRVGLYLGNPSSLLKDPASGQEAGVGFELGKELARRLGVAFEPVVYPNNGAVLDGMRAGSVDVLFTNATPARAEDVDFTQPYLEVEAGYLVRQGSPVRTIADIDKPGVRVGVMEGSTSSVALPRLLKDASVVRVPTVAAVVEMLSSGQLDAFATNKSILFEMSDSLRGSSVLDGRYAVEQLALGLPKGRAAGLPFVRSFVAQAVSSGLVKAAVERAGFRGGNIKAQ